MERVNHSLSLKERGGKGIRGRILAMGIGAGALFLTPEAKAGSPNASEDICNHEDFVTNAPVPKSAPTPQNLIREINQGLVSGYIDLKADALSVHSLQGFCDGKCINGCGGETIDEGTYYKGDSLTEACQRVCRTIRESDLFIPEKKPEEQIPGTDQEPPQDDPGTKRRRGRGEKGEKVCPNAPANPNRFKYAIEGGRLGNYRFDATPGVCKWVKVNVCTPVDSKAGEFLPEGSIRPLSPKELEATNEALGAMGKWLKHLNFSTQRILADPPNRTPEGCGEAKCDPWDIGEFLKTNKECYLVLSILTGLGLLGTGLALGGGIGWKTGSKWG